MASKHPKKGEEKHHRENRENGEEKRKLARPKLHMEDLATRITKTNAGEDYEKVCIKNVFDRIKFESVHMLKPAIPDGDISVSLPSKLAANLNKMGITQLLPTQRYTLPLLVDHDTDVFVGAATGHGKTLAFLIPVAVSVLRLYPRDKSSCRRPLALIIANTQVLQVQTYNVCKNLIVGTGLRCVLVCGETSQHEQKREIEQGVDILIATTGRLLDFLRTQVLSLDELKYYIYDEADKMTQLGAFRDEVADIKSFIPDEAKANLRSCFFTATLEAITSFDNMYRMDKFCMVRVPGNPLITHQIIPLDLDQDNEKEKSLLLMRLLQKDVKDQGRILFDKSTAPYLHKTIVFVEKKIRCNYLAAYLNMYGFSVGVANSDLSLKMRNHIIERFSKGEIQALIATDSMARGHDIPNVTHVINYDLADNALDTFKHRAGRTARIGHSGTCTTLLSRKQFMLFDSPLITELVPARQRAAELARYLIVDCGQRVPKCLTESARFALKAELLALKIDDDLDEILDQLAEMLEADEEPYAADPPAVVAAAPATHTTRATRAPATRPTDAAVTPAPAADTTLPAYVARPTRTGRAADDTTHAAYVARPTRTGRPTPSEDDSQHGKQQAVKAAKVADFDDHDYPIFDASETERETEGSDDEDEEDDHGGVPCSEDDLEEGSVYTGDEDFSCRDTDSDAPRDYDLNDTLGHSDEEEEGKSEFRWTDIEDEDDETKVARIQAVFDGYKREMEMREMRVRERAEGGEEEEREDDNMSVNVDEVD